MKKSEKFDFLFSAFAFDMFDKEPLARALFTVLLKETDIEDFNEKVSCEYSKILQSIVDDKIKREADSDLRVKPFQEDPE